MTSDKIFLGIITARGGSKGIPRKNIKKIANKPLIDYTFNAVKDSKLLNRCILSSEDDEIIEHSKENNIEVIFTRPKELAKDETSSLEVLIHAVEYLSKKEDYIPDYIVTLQPTSPLRTAQDIDISIKMILEDQEADSLVSVCEVPHGHNPFSVMEFDGHFLFPYIKEKLIMRRQEKPIFYARNGAAIYITKYNTLIDEKRIIGDKCIPYFMSKEKSLDIDDWFDWDIMEYLLKKKGKK